MDPVDDFRPVSYPFVMLLIGLFAVAVVSAWAPGDEQVRTAGEPVNVSSGWLVSLGFHGK